MQLLIRFDITDYEAFKAAYDAASERRGQAGLNQLQLWREEGTARVWGLFDASDKTKADDWLSSETALREQITRTEAHFLRTA